MDPINLPLELLLYTISFLPLGQILSLSLISKSWNSFLKKHEANVYRGAAILHSFATQDQLSWDGTPDAFPLLEGVNSWKDFCRKRFLLELSWTGRLPAPSGTLSCLRGAIHHVKIDEQQGTAIVTFSTGGLSVGCIRDDVLLWALDPDLVRSYAHCEFSNGYLVFDRMNSDLEVWCRKSDLSQNPLSVSPDSRQLIAAANAFQSLNLDGEDSRGVFVPVRVISPPSLTRAFAAYRFVYPTLVVASEDTQEVYLFNIPSGEVEAKISIAVDADSTCLVTYVELNERHVFVCTERHGLLILPRSGAASGTLRFQPSDAEIPWRFDVFAIEVPWRVDVFAMAEYPANGLPYSEIPIKRTNKFPREHSPMCAAVHVSPCGSHIVLAMRNGLLFIIRDFENTLKWAGPHNHPIPTFYTTDGITNLAYEDDRIAFHSAGIGLLVIPHASPGHVPVSSRVGGEMTEPMWPKLFIAHVHPKKIIFFDVNPMDDMCSCVQITRTGLWFVAANIRNGRRVSELNYLNFSDFPQFP